MTEQTSTSEATVPIAMTVDGTAENIDIESAQTLLEVLRDKLGNTSTRGTCGIGVCGSCTVLVDDKATSSCIMLAVQAKDRKVTTSEGLCRSDGSLSDVQQAFVRRGAYQCSFCIPAMVVAVHEAISNADTGADVESVRESLTGNLCRCGTYPEILAAVTDVINGESKEDVIRRIS